jgi:YidC/Oxa1 family membrane protein insertase
MWSSFVEIFRAAIFASAHLFGGRLGSGILFVSFAVRLALLPLTLYITRRALAQQRRRAALQPQLKRLQARHASDPARLFAETRKLHQQHGVTIFDSHSLLGGLVQVPLLAALFSAVRSGLGVGVRFAWVADLARPDRLLIGLVASLAAGAAWIAPSAAPNQSAQGAAVLVAALASIVFLWSMSSAIALSWGAGSLVSALQSLLLRREYARVARA